MVLTFSSDSSYRFCRLLGFRFSNLLLLHLNRRWFSFCFRCFCCSCFFFSSSDRLFSLSFSNFWLLIPSGQDFGQRCTSDRPLEFRRTARLLFGFGCAFKTLFVLPSIQHRPCCLSGISLHFECWFTFCTEEREDLNRDMIGMRNEKTVTSVSLPFRQFWPSSSHDPGRFCNHWRHRGRPWGEVR